MTAFKAVTRNMNVTVNFIVAVVVSCNDEVVIGS